MTSEASVGCQPCRALTSTGPCETASLVSNSPISLLMVSCALDW
ncbi:Uncharacterised protein [Mycobacteroides abscessus subsp. abscessus]|nr:Uncharacterised protein [Mycobacteroides abscessus subsp. abscessus]